MSDKKRFKDLREIPYDCCVEICKFFVFHKDFLSVCLVFNGFHEYVKNMSPSLLHRLIFHLHKIPKKKLEFVRKLRVGSPKGIGNYEDFLKKIGAKTESKLFKKILRVYPKLENLELFLTFEDEGKLDNEFLTYIIQRRRNLRRIRFKNCGGVGIKSNIQSLLICVGHCDSISINFKLPSLTTLRLHSPGRFRKVETRASSWKIIRSKYDDLDEGNPLLVMLSWKKLPKLSSFESYRIRLSDFSDNIQEMMLHDSLINYSDFDKNPLKSKSLTKLELSGFSLCHLNNVSRIKNLRSLIIGSTKSYHEKFPEYLKETYIGTREDNNDLIFSIDTLPNLETLEIHNPLLKENFSIGGNTLSSLSCSYLPKLLKLQTSHLSFDIRLFNVPNLEEVHCINTFKVDLGNDSDGLKMKKIVLDQTCLGIKFAKNISRMELLERVSHRSNIRRTSGNFREDICSKVPISLNDCYRLKEFVSDSVHPPRSIFHLKEVRNCDKLEILRCVFQKGIVLRNLEGLNRLEFVIQSSNSCIAGINELLVQLERIVVERNGRLLDSVELFWVGEQKAEIETERLGRVCKKFRFSCVVKEK